MAKRQAKLQAFKARLRSWCYARWEKSYNRQLDYFNSGDYLDQIHKLRSSGALKLLKILKDEPFMEAEDEILLALRRQQQKDDEAKAYLELQRLENERQAAEFFNYALEHPELPEADRHLKECLDQAIEQSAQARREKAYYTSQLRFYPDYSLERLEAISRINQYDAEMREQDERVMQINKALESLPEID